MPVLPISAAGAGDHLRVVNQPAAMITPRPSALSEPKNLGRARPPWLRPLGLLLLGFIPVLAGIGRLVQLATVTQPAPEDLRFVESPMSAVLHIVGASVFAILGVFQFVPTWRRRWPKWHRKIGWILVPAAAVGTLGGLWMTAFYPLPPHDTPLLTGFRSIFGLLILVALAQGTRAARQRNFRVHGDWMLRAYALAMAAGTQSLLLAPVFVLRGPLEALPNTLIMGACWFGNLAFAELWIRRAKQ
jgi:uncharacterized membrane protein